MTLQDFFQQNKKVALAFSGGVDSAYLLYAAKKYGAEIVPYFVKTDFQPDFELEDARRLTDMLKIELHVLEEDVMGNESVISNPADRCYYCKKALMNRILEEAKKDGYTVLIDGTNASDDVDDRPGMRVLNEMFIRSPLRECGLTKQCIRELSQEADLFTWNKPAYACLATRIPYGTRITGEMLQKTQEAEKVLAELGFVDFRVRMIGNTARIQVRENQLGLVIKEYKTILQKLKQYYDAVLLDLETRA